MKKLILAITLISFATVSCKKEKTNIVGNLHTNTQPQQPEDKNEDKSYYVNGLTDVSIGNLDKAVIPINVVYNQGYEQKRITFSLSGLPENCSATLEPNSGIPGFDMTLNIESRLTTPGIYTLTLTGSSGDGLYRKYEFYLNIQNTLNCAKFLSENIQGTFATMMEGSSSTIHNNTFLKGTTSQSNTTLALVNLFLEDSNSTTSGSYVSVPGTEINITANCSNHTLIIPQQRVQGRLVGTTTSYKDYEISGTGAIDVDNEQLNITYTVIDYASNSYTYTMHADIKFE